MAGLNVGIPRTARAGQSALLQRLAVTSHLLLPVAALGAFLCTRLLPLRHRAALWGGLSHTCAPLLVQMLWIGQCPRPLPPEPASLVCLRPVEIFQLCAHWKCLPGFFTCLLFLLGQSLSTCHSHCRWRPAIS